MTETREHNDSQNFFPIEKINIIHILTTQKDIRTHSDQQIKSIYKSYENKHENTHCTDFICENPGFFQTRSSNVLEAEDLRR